MRISPYPPYAAADPQNGLQEIPISSVNPPQEGPRRAPVRPRGSQEGALWFLGSFRSIITFKMQFYIEYNEDIVKKALHPVFLSYEILATETVK